jgi:CHASE3 domain sensor protein
MWQLLPLGAQVGVLKYRIGAWKNARQQCASIYRLIIGFTSAFALLIGIGVLGYQQNAALVRDADSVSHTHQELARMASLAGAVDVADIGVRLAVLTHAPDTITVARAAVARIDPTLAELRVLIDKADQQQRLDRLEPLLRAHVADLEAALSGADPTVVQPAIEPEIDLLIQYD